MIYVYEFISHTRTDSVIEMARPNGVTGTFRLFELDTELTDVLKMFIGGNQQVSINWNDLYEFIQHTKNGIEVGGISKVMELCYLQNTNRCAVWNVVLT